MDNAAFTLMGCAKDCALSDASFGLVLPAYCDSRL